MFDDLHDGVLEAFAYGSGQGREWHGDGYGPETQLDDYSAGDMWLAGQHEAALHAVRVGRAPKRPRRKPGPRPRYDFAAYSGSTMSQSEIARRLGCSRMTVKYHLGTSAVPQGKWTVGGWSLERLLPFVVEGRTHSDIARAAGCSHATVTKYVGKSPVPRGGSRRCAAVVPAP